MSDYYAKDKSRLRGRPKKTIGDYVASQGILVPRRFASLEDVRKANAWLCTLVRSEHPDEYNGPSGLLRSKKLEELADNSFYAITRALIDGPALIETYCRLTKADKFLFLAQVSFSLWELLRGYNRTVIADSAVKGKYHITTTHPNAEGSYTIYEGGGIKNYGFPLSQSLRRGLPKLVEAYEAVRHLPRFDPNHCPLMEFQTMGGRNYFLQYHRTRDFERATFSLKRAPHPDEVEALFVRGMTPSEGMRVKVLVDIWLGVDNSSWNLPDGDGSLEVAEPEIISEIMSRRRKAMIIETEKLEEPLYATVRDHLGRSQLFKPAVSMIIPKNKLLSKAECEASWQRAIETRENQYIDVHLVSDGRKAYVRRVQ